MKTLVKIVVFITLFVGFAKAQILLPMGPGQKNSVNIGCSDGDKLWVVNYENDKFSVNKWDGQFWLNLSEIPTSLLNLISTTPQSIEAKGICYNNGELFVAFANKNTEKLLLLKNTGKSWTALNTVDVKITKNLSFLKTPDGLLLCGKISVKEQLVSIVKVNGNEVSVYAGLSANHSANDYFTGFEYNKGNIWAFGYFTFNKESRYFAKLINGNWSIVPQSQAPFVNGNLAMGKYNDKLVMAGVDFDGKSSFSIQNTDTTWAELSNGLTDWKIISISDLKFIGQNFWAAGQFTNTKNSKQASLAYWNGNVWMVPEFDFDYLGNDLKLNGLNRVMVTGSFTQYQGLTLNHTGILEFGTALIGGKIFNDLNENCIQDFGESSLKGVVVKLVLPSGQELFINSDYNGRYYFPVSEKPNSYFVELILPKYSKGTCGNTLKPATISSQLTLADINFGLKMIGDHTDAASSLADFTGWRARQGFEERYLICAENKGSTKIEAAKLIFNFDERLNPWTFDIAPEIVKNNSAEWQILSLKTGEKFCVNAKVTIPLSIALESRLAFNAKVVLGDIEDEDLKNNVSELNQKVVAAIDPNDKRTEQNYLIPPDLSSMTYKIRFQNTGNDMADHVVITDTIDQNLNYGKLGTSLIASHNIDEAPVFRLLPNGKYLRIMNWRFNAINLPPKNSNEEASQGFINYTIHLSANSTMPIGTSIKNMAFIYFDYQEPILTNIARNLVSKESGVKRYHGTSGLSIYPNPAHDQLYFSNSKQNTIDLDVINGLGQTVLSTSLEPFTTFNFNVKSWPKGLYFVKTNHSDSYKLLID